MVIQLETPRETIVGAPPIFEFKVSDEGNTIPPFFYELSFPEIHSAEDFRDFLLAKEKEIRVPSLAFPGRENQFLHYSRNGYNIVGYQIPENGSMEVFDDSESIAIRAYLAAQYLHPNLEFFDPAAAQEAQFVMESEDFFNSGDFVLLILDESGQIVSHIGIEGPIEPTDDISLKDLHSRTKLHYVEQIYQKADGRPILHDLVEDQVMANDTKELRRFAVRHELELSADHISDPNKRKHLEKIERRIIALETIIGLTETIPLLKEYEQQVGRSIHFVMDTDDNIVMLAINGLLGIIPKRGPYVPFLSEEPLPAEPEDYIDEYDIAYLDLEPKYISLAELPEPYDTMLTPRYTPRDGESIRKVNLNVFTLNDVIKGLARTTSNGYTREQEMRRLLDKYAKSKEYSGKLLLYHEIMQLLSSGFPIVSELIPPLHRPGAIAATAKQHLKKKSAKKR